MRYRPNMPLVLCGISFRVEPGHKVGRDICPPCALSCPAHARSSVPLPLSQPCLSSTVSAMPLLPQGH